MKVLSITSYEFMASTIKQLLEDHYPKLDFIHINNTEEGLRYLIDLFEKQQSIDLLIIDYPTKKINGVSFTKIATTYQDETNMYFPILIFSILEIPEKNRVDFGNKKIRYQTTNCTKNEFLEVVENLITKS